MQMEHEREKQKTMEIHHEDIANLERRFDEHKVEYYDIIVSPLVLNFHINRLISNNSLLH